MSKLKSWLSQRFKRRQRDDSELREPTRSAVPATSDSGTTLAPSAGPWDAIDEMSRWMDRMVASRLLATPWQPFGAPDMLQRWFGDHRTARFEPRVDVTDEGDALVVSAELPGLGPDDVTLELTDAHLILRGDKRHERESREAGCYRLERSYGRFERYLPLPADLDRDRAEASHEDGVLTVRLPKREADARDRVKRIPIRR